MLNTCLPTPLCPHTHTMGGANSVIAATISTKINTSEKSVCSVENVCQGVQVDDVNMDGVTLDCDTIRIGDNSSKSSFTCSLNQAAMSTANVVQKMMASATASWGDISNTEIDQNVAVSISNSLQEQCGGAAQAVGGSPAAGMMPNGGACHSGIVQNSTIKGISFEDTKLDCNVLDIGVNNANTSVQCALQQASKADSSITQQGKAIAKDANIFMSILIGFLAVALFIIIGPFIVGGIIKTIRNFHDEAANQVQANDMEAQLRMSERELQLEQVQGAVVLERKKLERLGMRQDEIGFHKALTLHTTPPPRQAPRVTSASPTSTTV